MPRPRRADVRPKQGRPQKPINWDVVDELLLSGCSGAQIAPHFDMHPATFYDRCLLEKGVLFTDYSVGKCAKGESILKHHQFKKAIGATKIGDTQLLMFLGKVRLNQKETSDAVIEPEKMTQYLKILAQLELLQNGRGSAILSKEEPDNPSED